MAAITKRGTELAIKLSRNGWHSLHEAETCSLIARHARSLHHAYEAACNGHPAMSDPRIPIAQAQEIQREFEVWLSKREEQLERRITELASKLSQVSAVRFNGDPRGAPVVLVTKDSRGDSWSEPRGWCVN